MAKQSYKQMLIESLIDISGMSTYKTPADKVLNMKDEKFETFRSATSEVDVLGRAYAGQDDWDNTFITENDDMDDSNLEQGEPNVKVSLPKDHKPDVTDLEKNIDESDPDKNYQDPITSQEDAKSKLNVEGAEDPAETTEDDEDEDNSDDGTVTEPTEGVPTEDELQTQIQRLQQRVMRILVMIFRKMIPLKRMMILLITKFQQHQKKISVRIFQRMNLLRKM